MWFFFSICKVEKASGWRSVWAWGRRRHSRRGRRDGAWGHQWRRCTWTGPGTRTTAQSWSRAGVLLQTEHLRLRVLLPRQLLAHAVTDLSRRCRVCAVPTDFSLTFLLCSRWPTKRTWKGGGWGRNDPKWLSQCSLSFTFCSIFLVRHEWSRSPQSPFAHRGSSNDYAM